MSKQQAYLFDYRKIVLIVLDRFFKETLDYYCTVRKTSLFLSTGYGSINATFTSNITLPVSLCYRALSATNGLAGTAPYKTR